MPAGKDPAFFRPRRDGCRTTSWLESTQVVVAPTESLASSDSVITARYAGTDQRVLRNSKLNAWCVSSGRTYRASCSIGWTQASATRARSPGYSATTCRQPRKISCTPSWSHIGPSSGAFGRCLRPMTVVVLPVQSGSPGALTSPCATSIRNPPTPRSSQKRSTCSNSARTCAFSQFRSGWLESNRCRYHSPGLSSASVTLVQAGPPNLDSQLFGGSSPSSPRPVRNTYLSRAALPGADASASWNQPCADDVWFGTRSTSTRRPCSCAAASSASTSARVPRSG